MLKWFSKCEGCGKRKILIKNRAVKFPLGVAVSQKLICAACRRAVQKVV